MPEGKQPRVAIVCPNSLSVVGLRQLITGVNSMVSIDAFATADEFRAAGVDNYFHFFVDVGVLMAERNFFLQYSHKTIVLTTQADHQKTLSDFHCLCIAGSESQMVRSLLALMSTGHAQHPAHATTSIPQKKVLLSPREIEVLSLVVQGFINKEISDKLNISLTTVITHRKNITEKLGMRSVSALTIYAVMNGYVDIGKI